MSYSTVLVQADIGHGVVVPCSKFDYLWNIDDKSRFVKELVAAVGGTSVLTKRTFTAALDNRSKSQGKTEVFPGLTPKKVEAVRGKCSCLSWTT